MVSIIDMDNVQARKFFLKNKSYFTLNLPRYFDFSNILNNLSNEIGENIDNYQIFLKGGDKNNNPKNFEDVNYSIMTNKDGKYGRRRMQLINPVLYVMLVHYLTKKSNWDTIIKKIKSFKNDNIICTSWPCESDTKKSDTGTSIENRLHFHEEYGLQLSLDFPYLIKTDISLCYHSIYTHSMCRIFDGIENCKKARLDPKLKKNLFGNYIDEILMCMSNGQTNGIPEGSVLMDFLAELLLGLIDSMLLEKINKDTEKPKGKYKILRFRDDYNIFIDNPNLGNYIVKELSSILSSMRMKINESKTIMTDNVVGGIIKKDKIHRYTDFIGLLDSDIANNDIKYINSLKKDLLIINKFSEDYPNSGSLYDMLKNFSENLDGERINKFTDIKVLVGIVINIAYHSPRVYPHIFKIISILLKRINDTNEIKYIFESILNKLNRLPKSEYLNLWIGRIAHKYGIKCYTDSDSLCEIVDSNDNSKLRNNDWLEKKYVDIINNTPMIDKNELETMPDIIQEKEIDPFYY